MAQTRTFRVFVSSTFTCPVCRVEHPLDETWLGQVIDCPAGCGTRLEIVEPSALRAGHALHLSSPRPEPEAPIRVLKGHAEGVWAVAFSPDGTRIVSGSGDKTLKIWDADSGQNLATLSGHEQGVNAVAYPPDGTRIVSASGKYSEQHIREEDNALMVWDATTGKRLATLRPENARVLGDLGPARDKNCATSGRARAKCSQRQCTRPAARHLRR